MWKHGSSGTAECAVAVPEGMSPKRDTDGAEAIAVQWVERGALGWRLLDKH